MTNTSAIPSEVEAATQSRTLPGQGQAFHPGAKASISPRDPSTPLPSAQDDVSQ